MNTESENTLNREWLEADGLGGFASGTVGGARTRRYHALLLTATQPPTGRMVLVNGFDAWVETANGSCLLSTQSYAPGVLTGEGAKRLEAFGAEPWPHWIFRLDDGARIEFELFVVKDRPLVCLSWRVLGLPREVKLRVRPFLSGRDYHALHRHNLALKFDATDVNGRVAWQPYPEVPGVTAMTNGAYQHEPLWYYNFLYPEERARGLDCEEDLAAPGVFSWNLADGPAALILTTTEHATAELSAGLKPAEFLNKCRDREKVRRDALGSSLSRAADAYLVRRGDGRTIIAGYPWFTDWGRDTFIALRGLCLATNRLADARDILLAWAGAVSEGMLPNRFSDHGEGPEYNAVDASLWYVIAVHEFLEAAQRQRLPLNGDRKRLLGAVEQILQGYSRGTRYGIRMDADGLLACGAPGVQLTWMDAKVGDWVVTPRTGKPVEVQALWLNALWIGSRHHEHWNEPLQRGAAAFQQRFWNPERKALFDVVDVNHQPGTTDSALRPNQIFAVGGLPFPLLAGEQARLVVEAVEDQLLTPAGLRSLAPGEASYAPRYEGGVRERDGAYHQGTVWPWLLGAFVEAWLRVHGDSAEARRIARRRFLEPALRHFQSSGPGHIPEIADAEPPHTPRGCPWQAWSVGELLRLDRVLLAARPGKARRISAEPHSLVPA